MILIPIATSPYIARVLGPGKIGIYTYANSIAYYFYLFSLLGINTYGTRKIAKVRNDSLELTSTFWNIYYIQFFLTIIFSFTFFVLISQIHNQDKNIFILQILYVISAGLEIEWFPNGLEKFRFVTIRSTITRLLIVLLIFLFVKKPTDLWKYTVLINGGNIVSCILVWPLVFKTIKFKPPNIKSMQVHIRPIIILFLPSIAMSIYQQIDKILLGIFSTSEEIGYFSSADNIVSLPLNMIIALGTVMMSYCSSLVANNKEKKLSEVIQISLRYINIINIGLAFGLLSVVNTFIPWFLGKNYVRTADLIEVLSISIFIGGFSEIIRTQYLIPKEKDIIYFKSILIGGLVNIIVGFVLVKKFSAVGVVWGTVISYTIVLVLQVYYLKDEIRLKKVIIETIPYVLFAVVMVLVIRLVSNIVNLYPLWTTIIEIIIGILVYSTLSVLWLIYFKKDKILSKILKFS